MVNVNQQAEINVEVAYATPEEQKVIAVALPSPGTVKDAILASGILQTFPEINLEQQPVGIFGKKVALDTQLELNDRVEIYRPLTIDPKQARRLRAQRHGKKQQNQ